MATATQDPIAETARRERPIVGPDSHGLAMAFDDFIRADHVEGWLYELARGIVIATEVPGIHHGRIVSRFTELFVLYAVAHPDVINYRAGGGECRLRLPGMKSDRHPDQAIYLHPDPKGPGVWTRWVPQIVVEVVSRSGEDRDYVEKREEYLRIGVLEYWILDAHRRRMLVLRRAGDVWEENLLGEACVHRTELLPGLEASVGDLLGPLVDEEED
jgi:Uma2 family endonuclease